MASKECEKTRKLLPLYIDSMLSDKDGDEVLKHLDECPDCKSEYNYLKAIIGTIKDIPQKELSSDFHKNLMEKVKTQSRKKKKTYSALRHISAGVAVAAAAAAAVAISFVALGEIDKPEEMNLTDQFLTSRVSDEPVQKDAEKPTDNSSVSEKKNVNKKTYQVLENTVIEEKEIKTEEQIPASASLDEETIYTTATIEATEEIKEEVLKILSQYEKDEKGYIVPDIDDVIEKIKNVGASVDVDNTNTNARNYITVK